MSTLICGSIAFDSIMVFNGRFKDHILPDQVHVLSVSFVVPTLTREFGGTAGNIAYSLKMLGGEPLPMATLGQDGQPYLDRFTALGISTAHLTTLTDCFTAQAFITTDLDDNQITAFHPGAMTHAQRNTIAPDLAIDLAIVAPDGKEGMISHTQQLAARGVPFIFDPGQAIPLFSGPELLSCIERASYLAVNDYEAQLLVDKTGVTLAGLAQRVQALIVTLGAEGSRIVAGKNTYEIPVAPATALVDPTGCGDAYRAGLLYGLSLGVDWPTCGRVAAAMGSLKIAAPGAQNHRVDRDIVSDHFHRAYGYRPW